MAVTPTDPAPQPRPSTDASLEPDRPVLPERAEDDLDVGWGDDLEADARDEEWYRRERPPHHE